MSTDEQRNEPDESTVEPAEPAEAGVTEQPPTEEAGAPSTSEEPAVEEPAEAAVTEEPEPIQAEEPEPPTVAENEAALPEEPGTAAAETPERHDPAPDETHVALPVQRRDDPFAEVDGGDPDAATSATTAFPTPEEDAALRDERARRFGRPRPEGEESEEETQAVPVSEEEPTSRVPLAEAGAGAVATVAATEPTQTMPATTAGQEDPFKDFDEGPASRAAAHWWSILISVVFVPVAWYLITDGGERMSFNLTNGGSFNLAGPLELAGGALCLFFVLLAARWSSVGAILVGTVSALLGIAFIVFNTEAMELVTEYQGTLVQALEQLGQNIVDHTLADARSGRLAIYGIALIMVGVVSHGARRQGRREERRKAALGV